MDFTIFYKESYLENEINSLSNYDIFFSAFDNCSRTIHVFNNVNAISKIWLIFPHFNFKETELPDGEKYTSDEFKEDDYYLNLSENFPIDSSKKLCIDASGFIRPHLIYLIKYLSLLGLSKIDILYSEPKQYIKADETGFSGFIDDVRLVEGYSSIIVDPDTESDLLILVVGYDDNLIAKVCQAKKYCKNRYYIIGFPSLQPDMYQESVLKLYSVKESIGENIQERFAPAYDPFVTAQVLDGIIKENPNAKNIYISPLSTKPQTIGMALYYIWNYLDKPLNIIFPFSSFYNSNNAVGIKRIWKYTFEFPQN